MLQHAGRGSGLVAVTRLSTFPSVPGTLTTMTILPFDHFASPPPMTFLMFPHLSFNNKGSYCICYIEC